MCDAGWWKRRVRLAGDIRHAGIYFSLMNRRVGVSAIKRDLLSRRFNLANLREKGMLAIE
jgi:hypothetical protein